MSLESHRHCTCWVYGLCVHSAIKTAQYAPKRSINTAHWNKKHYPKTSPKMHCECNSKDTSMLFVHCILVNMEPASTAENLPGRSLSASTVDQGSSWLDSTVQDDENSGDGGHRNYVELLSPRCFCALDFDKWPGLWVRAQWTPHSAAWCHPAPPPQHPQCITHAEFMRSLQIKQTKQHTVSGTHIHMSMYE